MPTLRESMQKETLIAILIGLTLGLFVTYGLYQFKQSVTTPPVAEIVTDGDKNTENEDVSKLQITSPEDGLIQTENELIVSGQTSEPNSYVVVFVGNDETILQSDDSNNFSATVDLEDGANVVTIINIDQDGQLIKEERVVAVTSLFAVDEGNDAEEPEQAEENTEESADTTSNTETEEAEESTTQAILDRINRKLSEEQQEELAKTIEQLSVKRKALIGQIERVTEEALTITTTEGTVILPIDKDTTIQKAGKNIKIDDVAVENWALIMGMTDDTTIKPEQIIISTTTLRPNPQFVMIGTVLEIEKSSLTLTNRSDSNQVELSFDKNTDYEDLEGESAKLSNFSSDLTVLVVGYEKTVKDKTSKLLTTMRALAVFED